MGRLWVRVRDGDAPGRRRANVFLLQVLAIARLLLFLGGIRALAYLEWKAFKALSGFGGDELAPLRYVLPFAILPLWIFVGSLSWARQVYGLPSVVEAFGLLLARLSLVILPSLRLGSCRVAAKKEEVAKNLVETCGGPAWLILEPGQAAVLERADGSWRVVLAGRCFLHPGERLKEVVSLEEHQGGIEEVRATTRDGIPLRVGDVHFRYRLYCDDRLTDCQRTRENPFPCAEITVAQVAYRHTQTESGLTTWHQEVGGMIYGALQDFIWRNMVDYLTAPRAGRQDPRSEFYHRLFSKEGRQRFNAKGVDLLWLDMGHFHVPVGVKDQRLENWFVRWLGGVMIQKAHDEAQRTAQIEEERADAQVELLISILRRVETFGAQRQPALDRQTLYLAVVSQVLDMLSQSVVGERETKETQKLALEGSKEVSKGLSKD